MRKIINSIKLEDFRSFESEMVNLEDVTCLVGANESGKTNLLDGINLALSKDSLSGGKKRVTSISDTRKNSERYKNQQSPKITFSLSPQIITNPVLAKGWELSNKDKLLLLVRENNVFNVELHLLQEAFAIVKNISDKDFKLQVEPSLSSEETLENPPKLVKAKLFE